MPLVKGQAPVQKSNRKIFLSIVEDDAERLTNGFLDQYYSITTQPQSLDKQEVDLIITDQYAIEDFHEKIRFFKETQPDNSPPVLLLCQSAIREVPLSLVQLADDLLPISSSRDVISARVELLLSRREYEQQLHKKAFYSQLFENTNEPILRLDSFGKLLEANQSGKCLIKCETKQLRGLHFTDLVPEEYKKPVQKAFEKAFNMQKQEFEGEVLDFQGKRIAKYFKFIPVQSPPRIKNLYLMLGDTTLQKSVELKSEQNHKLLELITEKSGVMCFLKDINKRYVYVNSQWKKLHGMEGKDVIGKTPRELFGDSKIRRSREKRDEWVIKHQKERVDELRYGDICYISHRFPLTDILGIEGAVGCIGTDITPLKKAEERRKRQQETLTYLATSRDFDDASFNERISIIADSAKNALQVDLVCLREINHQTATCVAKCNTDEASGEKPAINKQSLAEYEYPAFFYKIKNREAVIQSDASQSENKEDLLCLKMGFRAFMSNVIKPFGNQSAGFVTFFSKEPKEWEDDEKVFGEAISDQIAKAYANEEMKQYLANLEKLNEKDTLLKEIHHRVKNNMAVVSSLLQMQAMTENDDGLREKLMQSVNRIKAMANVHEQLYKNTDFSEINIGHHVESLTQNILTSYNMENKVETELDCPPIQINITKAIPLSLICHEVISNSVKHAFKNRKKGVISITLRENNGEIYCKISDNGSGLKREEKKSDSMGMQIIEGLIAQIEGKHKYYTEKEGTSFELRLKKEE